MTKIKNGYAFALAAALSMTIAGCGGSGSAPEPEAASTTGFLDLSMSDGPVHEFSKVCLEIREVALRQDDGWTSLTLDPAEKIDLMQFQGGNAKPVIVGAEMLAGTYEEVRLIINTERGGNGGLGASPGDQGCTGEGSYVVRKDGGIANLFVPSGSQSGVKFKGEITIPVNSTAHYTIEIDLGRSFREPPGQAPDVMMKPVAKVVANNEVGTLVGKADTELATADQCAPSVFVYDDGVSPNPIDDAEDNDAADPVATATLSEQTMDDGSVEWRYEIGFLLTGNYEAAFTCNGNDFVPIEGKPAAITAGQVTTVDFFVEDQPGSLTGQVADAYFDAAAPGYPAADCAADFAPLVALFPGDVVPDITEEPIATGLLEQEVRPDDSTAWRYSIAPLTALEYTAAFTCDGETFIPVNGKPAEIRPAAETTVDFFAEDAS
jgi:hypothetical protein